MPVLVDGELVLYGFCGDDWFDEGFTDREVIDALAEIGRETDVTVRLNSPGGYAYVGKAIFNALKAHAGRVTVVVDSMAISAASIIAMAGDDVVMRTGALMMIHDASGMTFGDAEEHRRSVEWLERESAALASIYAEKTGGSADDMRALMKAETWMTAEEAVEQGFADRTDAARAAAVAAFDYRAYAKAPKGLKARARKENWSLDEARKAVASATGNHRRKENPMTDKPAAGNSAATPAPATAPATTEPPATPPASAAQQPAATPPVNLEEVRAQARAEEAAYRDEIEGLCALAGAPDRARAFIEKRATAAEVRKQLLEARASADAGRQIATQHSGTGGTAEPQKGALAARMTRMVGKKEG